MQKLLVTTRNTSETRGKIPVKTFLGRIVILSARADFELCEPILFKANEKTKTFPVTLIIGKGLNTTFIKAENSIWTILVSDNQTAILYEDNVKT